MNASTVTKTNRAYGLVRRSKPYYHTTGGGGKEEQQQEQEQEQEEGRRRNGPAELCLSKRGQSRQAKCSCRGARQGCRGNTGGGGGEEGQRYGTPTHVDSTGKSDHRSGNQCGSEGVRQVHEELRSSAPQWKSTDLPMSPPMASTSGTTCPSTS